MAAVDDEKTFGRARLSFASEAEIDEFVQTLRRFESGELAPDEWRRYRLVRGTYGQRQPDDVHMLRVKIPQGILTSVQLRALADVATTYSRGFGHITTRQNVQLHFVRLHTVEAALRRLADDGLTTREACGNSVRNITACAFAGTAEDEVFDVSPYADALTRYFLRHPLSSSLPRKFKIAFEGCADDHAVAAINDLGWRARIVEGRRGFRVTVAGGTSILPVSAYLLFDFLPADEMFQVAEAVVRVFHRFGDYQHRSRNRLKFLIRSLGWEAWRARFDEALAEVRREGTVPLPFDPDAPPVEQAPDWQPAATPSIATVAQLAHSGTVVGPGLVPGTVRLQTLPDAYVRWIRSNVRRQKQPGYALVTARLPLGDVTAGQMRAVADLAEAYGDATVRVTIGQNLLFRWVKLDAVEALYQRLEAAGLSAPDAGTLADVVSCPGAETCRLAVTQSRGLGRMLTEHLSERPDLVDLAPKGDIKISGCPNGCGQHHIAAIGFQGSVRKLAGRPVPQYFVMIGGGAHDGIADFGRVVAKIPVRRLVDAVDRLLELYRDNRAPDEPLGAYFRRVPTEVASDALADLTRLSLGEASMEDFIDLEEEQEFKPEVMDGECSV
ncbi:MAG TPA: nitrite/sulfite reductase [Vicinamibacterales bacterium]|jgi:sulfite reductase (NADPH) hemoprotein beta-component|nr:nitrite/sulfite reductase [Vicinamibacterales bacterium]